MRRAVRSKAVRSNRRDSRPPRRCLDAATSFPHSCRCEPISGVAEPYFSGLTRGRVGLQVVDKLAINETLDWIAAELDRLVAAP